VTDLTLHSVYFTFCINSTSMAGVEEGFHEMADLLSEALTIALAT